MAKRQAPHTIGIMGAGPGCGATHFTLLLANYLAAVEWKRTAVLEWNDHHELKELIGVCTGTEEDLKPASILDVDYFCDGGAEELAWCMDKEYECILMDFGCVQDGKKAEFLQCSQKLFLGAFNEWKLRYLIAQKDWMLKGKGSWNYLSVFGGEEAKKEFKRRFGLPFRSVPYAPDAFIIQRDMAVFLKTIWREKQ
ncbi:MAG: hypothetical protein HFG49_10125 [Lachnospiraceae bacterium]|nr:hypothetical protein [Lachnospiraceae bacterium]